MRQGHHARANQSGQCSRDSREELASHVPGSFIFEESPGQLGGRGGAKVEQLRKGGFFSKLTFEKICKSYR